MKRIYLAFVFVAAFSAAAHADFDDGTAAYQRGDYGAAYQEWLPLAEGGDVRAQYHLAVLYEEGRGVAKDLCRAAHWYAVAGINGDDQAASRIAGLAVREGEPASAEVLACIAEEQAQAEEAMRLAEAKAKAIAAEDEARWAQEEAALIAKVEEVLALALQLVREQAEDAERKKHEADEAEKARAIVVEAEARRAQEEAALIAKVEEEARKEQEVLALAQQLASEQAEEAELRKREADEAAVATMEDLLKQIAEQQKLLEALLDTEPPLIKIISAPESFVLGEGSYQIAGVVGDMDGPPRKLTINGERVPLFKLSDESRKIAAHTMAFAVEVTPTGESDQTFVIEAFDAADNKTTETVVVKITVANRPNIQGKNYALIIGNNDYDFIPQQLKTAVGDAEGIAEVLYRKYAYDEGSIKLLTNATRREILGALSAFRRTLRKDDRFLLYYAGHGHIDPATDEGFWLPIDAEPESDFTWISNYAIKAYLGGMPAKHVLVIADAEFSGSLTRGAMIQNENEDKFFLNIDKYPSRKIITSGGLEPVAVSGSGGHSVFAYYLIKALEENTRPYMTSFQLYDRLVRAVTNNSNQMPEFGTIPDSGDQGSGDFTFILRAPEVPGEALTAAAAESYPVLQGVSLAPMAPVFQLVPPRCGAPMNNRPGDFAEQFEWLEQLRNCIEAAKQRDLLTPELRIEAPEQVEAGAGAYHLSGYVGDDRDGLVIYVDGRAVDLMAPGDGAPDLGAYTYAFDVEVAIVGESDNRHIVEAEDAAGNPVAKVVVVRVISSNMPKFPGKYHALIIGNSEYEFLPPAPTAEADARTVAEVLNRRYAFDKENIKVLVNATRRDILGSMSALRKNLKRHDRLLIYYAGHSYLDGVTGEGYWQGVDADEFDDFTWVQAASVRVNIAGMLVRHVLVIADAVFPLAVTRGTTRAERDRYFEEIDSYYSRKMIAAGVLTPTPDTASGRHSAFAYHLLRILEENREPYIISKQLFDRLARRLAGNSDYNPEWGTIANTGDEGSGEFTFILRVPEALGQTRIAATTATVSEPRSLLAELPPAPPVSLMTIQFAYDSDELTPAAKQQLDVIGRALNSKELRPYGFLLVGHTDGAESPDDNKRLSERRASAALEYLVQTSGVDASRLHSAGLGAAVLLDVDDPANGRNRRVEVFNMGDDWDDVER